MLPQPDLVVADHWFAGVAAAVGLEVVAFADLDAMALAIAVVARARLRVVPLDEHAAPQAYAPLLELLDEAVEAPAASV